MKKKNPNEVKKPNKVTKKWRGVEEMKKYLVPGVIVLTVLIILAVILPCVGKKFCTSSLRSNATLDVIHNRKSVRSYIDKPVTEQDLNTLLKAGMAAPTAVDKRPWAFVAITDKEVLAGLANGLPYGRMLNTAGAAIVVCGVLDKALPGVAREFWIQDCSAATENILLAAESLKLGAVWIGVYPIAGNIHHVRTTLSMPEDVIPLNILSIGYPTGDEKPKDKFDEANIHWDKW
ncbi:nitroreductase family protein [Candidatus Omnitrophota bacterium]